MELRWILISVIIGMFAFAHAHLPRPRRDAEEFNDGVLCNLSAAKRMLKSIGIASSSKCLLNNKRDVANLVTTYLNMGEDKRSEEKRYQKRDFYKELEDLLEDTLNTKRSGPYCCSPACNAFMATLGHPDANTITCE